MHTSLPILRDLVVAAAVAVVAVLALERLRLPVLAVLLVAGAVAGPHALGLVSNPGSIEVLAQTGVVLLLFTIGLEFRLRRLAEMWRAVLIGGALQVGVTAAAVALVARGLGTGGARAVFYGCLVALSSTAIVLRALSERGELDTPHGRLITGALIFQDLCVVPMMLLVPVLAGGGGQLRLLAALWAIGKAVALVVAILVVARKVVPPLFARVDRVHSREAFVLTVLVVCLGTAWLSSRMGLSLALGAFLAGVMLAGSDFAHRALGDVLPVRDVLSSFFFISLGMLFDVHVLLERPAALAALVGAIVVGKALLAGGCALVQRVPPRVAVLVGLGLAQVSEFGFVLAGAGRDAALISPAQSRVLLAAGVLTMLLAPLTIRLAPHLAAHVGRVPWLERLFVTPALAGGGEDPPPHGHVVIVGYGVAGQVLAHALRENGTAYTILEINLERVVHARAEGEPAFYGDVANPDAVQLARVREARALVLLIDDPPAAERAIAAARQHAPGTPILVRARHLRSTPGLLALGADEVVADEVEAGLEVLARVLRRVGTARNLLNQRVRRARERTQTTARELTVPRPRLGEVPELGDLKVESFLVTPTAHAAGRTTLELELRARTGALVVAVRRGETLLEQTDPSDAFRPGDMLYLVGSRDALARAILELEGCPPPSQDTDGVFET